MASVMRAMRLVHCIPLDRLTRGEFASLKRKEKKRKEKRKKEDEIFTRDNNEAKRNKEEKKRSLPPGLVSHDVEDLNDRCRRVRVSLTSPIVSLLICRG